MTMGTSAAAMEHADVPHNDTRLTLGSEAEITALQRYFMGWAAEIQDRIELAKKGKDAAAETDAQRLHDQLKLLAERVGSSTPENEFIIEADERVIKMINTDLDDMYGRDDLETNSTYQGLIKLKNALAPDVVH